MRTRRSATLALVMVTALLGALLLAATTSSAGASSVRLFTDLNGAEEVPGPGDPDGSGDAHLTLYPSLGIVCFTLRVSGIATPTAAHIHEAPAGVPGGVVVPLTAPTPGFSTGCKTADQGLLEDIAEFPEEYYVNVHNAAYPAGALRGQLGD